MTRVIEAQDIAQFVENHRDGLTACLQRALADLGRDDLGKLVPPWLKDQIAALRGGPNHTIEWVSRVVDLVRRSGGGIDELLALFRGTRHAVMQFFRVNTPPEWCADLYMMLADGENLMLKHLGQLYGEFERKRAASSQRTLQAMADLMVRPFVMLDAEGQLRQINASFANLTGRAAGRLIGEEIESFCTEETSSEIRRDLRQRRGAKARCFDGLFVNAQGNPIPARISIAPVFDEEGLRDGAALCLSGKPQGGVLTNLSNDARFVEEIADAIGLGFYVVDASGKVESANGCAQQFVEVGREDKLTGMFEVHRDGADDPCRCRHCAMARLLESGETHHDVLQLAGADSTMRWVETTWLPLRNPEGVIDHAGRFVRDITEQKIVEHQFLRQQSTSLASQLAVGVAHQLRNPLGVVIGLAEMLSHGMPPEQVPGAVERVLRSGLRCKEVVDSLLEFGRSVSGEPRLIDLTQLVLDTVQTAYAGPDSARITWALAPGLGSVRCSADRIALVLHHLVDNALHAARRAVHVETSGDGDRIEVRVWNDGPPIPPEARERLFQPFSSLHADDGVAGLSLSLSRAVAQEHGGDLFVEDGKDGGACFVLRLPLGGTVAVEAEREVSAPAPTPPSKRILIVEDDPDQVFLLQLALQTRGHEVDTAAAGAQALELLSSHEYSAVVIDILLGDELGGKDLYKILLKSDPGAARKTIFITGDTMKYETRQFLGEVNCPYLEKPFMVTQFTTEVESILASGTPDSRR